MVATGHAMQHAECNTWHPPDDLHAVKQGAGGMVSGRTNMHNMGMQGVECNGMQHAECNTWNPPDDLHAVEQGAGDGVQHIGSAHEQHLRQMGQGLGEAGLGEWTRVERWATMRTGNRG